MSSKNLICPSQGYKYPYQVFIVELQLAHSSYIDIDRLQKNPRAKYVKY